MEPARSRRLCSNSYQLLVGAFMGWLLEAIWWLICGVLEFLGAKYDWVREEIYSKPKRDVL